MLYNKQSITDDCFITVGCFLWNTIATFVFLMQQHCYCIFVFIEYEVHLKIADYCMCLTNCKSSVTTVPTIFKIQL